MDREREIEELRRLTERHRPALAIVYGRRRVGKSYLLRHTWEGQRVFSFVCADLPPAMNRAELLGDLAAWSSRRIDPGDYPTWRTVFRLLVDLATEAPLIVVLDEFQYLLQGGEDDPASQLAAVWDQDAQGRPLALILCGSEVATMQGLQGGGQPLYGRANWAGRIHPFDYRDAARMAPHLPTRDGALLYGVFGGTPKFLAAVDPMDSVPEAAIRTFLSPRGEVHLQLQTLVEQEKGIREPSVYRAVLAAVALGKTQLNGIAQASGVAGSQLQGLRKALSVLEDLDLIGRERNFAAGRAAPYRYRIADNAVRFWHRFVQPGRSRLEADSPRDVWESQVAPYLNDYMGKVFEGICHEAYHRYHSLWGLSGTRDWARWEGKDRNGRSIELDLVARLDGGGLLTGEVKWSARPVGPEVHANLLRNLEDLANSGHGWAREALSPPSLHLHISAGGFTEGFTHMADADPRVKLLALDDLYAV